MTEAAPLTCPKCEGEMRSYERNGIVIDQCRECRGVFLDRGELERMIDAEGAFLQQNAPAPPPQRQDRERSHSSGPSDHGGGYGGKKKKSKASFLSELFE